MWSYVQSLPDMAASSVEGPSPQKGDLVGMPQKTARQSTYVPEHSCLLCCLRLLH